MGWWHKLTGRPRLEDQPEFFIQLIQERLGDKQFRELELLQDQFQFLPKLPRSIQNTGDRRPGSVTPPLLDGLFKAEFSSLAVRRLYESDFETCETVLRIALDIWPSDLGPHFCLALCHAERNRIPQAHESALLACKWFAEVRDKVEAVELQLPHEKHEFLHPKRIVYSLASPEVLEIETYDLVLEFMMRRAATNLADLLKLAREEFLMSFASALSEGEKVPGLLERVRMDTAPSDDCYVWTVGLQFCLTMARVGAKEYLPEEVEPDFYRFCIRHTAGGDDTLGERYWNAGIPFERISGSQGFNAAVGHLTLQLIDAASTGRSMEQDVERITDCTRTFTTGIFEAVDTVFAGPFD